ncbi:MAG: hypothetical protein GQ524_01990 [Anaerolineales bacterium]|nr:hypothetical protein [Anaerolineales bacterium]
MEETETGQRITELAANTGVPPAVWYSMFQQTGFSPTQEEAAQLGALHEEGYTLTQMDPLSGTATYTEPTAAPSYPLAGGGTPSAPSAPSAPSDDGYKMFKWTEGGYEAEGGNVPSWWKAFVPEEVTPETSYGAMLNAMIPYLSPQDQVRVAHSLYGMFDTEMSHYKPGYIPEVSTITEDQMRYMKREGRPLTGVTGGSRQKTLATGETITTRQTKMEPMSDEMRRYFQSSDRAQDAIKTLSNMRESMVQGNRWKLGPGYKWLQNLMGSAVGTGAGGQSGQTRLQYQNMLSSVDPFLSQAGSGELQPFGPLGQMATKPFYTAGYAQPSYANNRFGTPNRRFF